MRALKTLLKNTFPTHNLTKNVIRVLFSGVLLRKRLSLDVNHSGIPVVRWKNVFFPDHMDGTAIKS